jgi:hypothetical protein
MNRIPLPACALLICMSAVAQDSTVEGSASLPFHDDYYEGFAQGVYYGLLLRGEKYGIAWCMKSELDYEAKLLGTGGEFQKRIEALLEHCRASSAGNASAP